MDSKKFGLLGGLGLVAGVLGYSLYKLVKQPAAPINPAQKQQLLLLLQQLKHQMFIFSCQYAKVFSSIDTQAKAQNLDMSHIKQGKQKEILKIYEARQKILLMKYSFSKQEFTKLLEKTYSKDHQVQRLSNEIEVLMEDAITGKEVSFQVPNQLKQALKPSVTLKLFVELHLELLHTFLNRAYELAETDPTFDVNNNEQVSKLIREINMFKLKVEFIRDHGPKIESMNHENFIKVVEKYKRESPQFKSKVVKFEALYITTTNKLGKKVDFDELREKYQRILDGTDQEEKEKVENVIEEVRVEEREAEKERVNVEEQEIVVVDSPLVEKVGQTEDNLVNVAEQQQEVQNNNEPQQPFSDIKHEQQHQPNESQNQTHQNHEQNISKEQQKRQEQVPVPHSQNHQSIPANTINPVEPTTVAVEEEVPSVPQTQQVPAEVTVAQQQLQSKPEQQLPIQTNNAVVEDENVQKDQ